LNRESMWKNKQKVGYGPIIEPMIEEKIMKLANEKTVGYGPIIEHFQVEKLPLGHWK